MAWPMKVARNAPAMPSTVVRMNPPGLFGPGERIRAMMPAIKPTTMIQMMPLMAVVPFQCSMMSDRCSEPAGQFFLVRQPAVGRQMIDDVGQILAQPLQQIIARQSALRGQRV